MSMGSNGPSASNCSFSLSARRMKSCAFLGSSFWAARADKSPLSGRPTVRSGKGVLTGEVLLSFPEIRAEEGAYLSPLLCPRKRNEEEDEEDEEEVAFAQTP